jgi:hypothetical protein
MCCAADLSGRGCANKQTRTEAEEQARPRECCQDGWNATSKKCKGDSKCIFKGAKGLGPPRPHLHRDWAHPAHISTGTRPSGRARRAGKHPDGSENGKQEYALGCLLCASSTGV